MSLKQEIFKKFNVLWTLKMLLCAGVPIDETEPPNPNFIFSFEESLLTRFLDYYIWRQSGTNEADVTTNPDRLPQTMVSFGAHLRNRLHYRMEKNELDINPILLSNPTLPPSQNQSKYI